MTELLLKMFVKNYKDTSNAKVRQKYGFLGSIFGVISNFILFLAKIIVGFLITNMSIIADAINNLSDFGSCFISIFGFKMSAKPADKDHPFGHARMEYIASLIVSFVIIALGIMALSEAVQAIIHPSQLPSDRLTLIVTFVILGLSIMIKILQGLFYRSLGKRIKSVSLKANSIDSRNDVITTFFVLIGLIISLTTKVNIDGYLALAVSLFVIYSGIKLTVETGKILLGEKPDQDLIRNFAELIKSCPGVLGLHDLEMHCYGPGNIHASVHIEVDSSVDVMLSHDRIDNIEKLVYKRLGVKTVAHMDPVLVGDPKTEKFKTVVRTGLAKINENISMHDFRIVSGPTHTNLVFDIVIPFGFKESQSAVKDKLEAYLRQELPGETVYLVITVDPEYSELLTEPSDKH